MNLSHVWQTYKPLNYGATSSKSRYNFYNSVLCFMLFKSDLNRLKLILAFHIDVLDCPRP